MKIKSMIGMKLKSTHICRYRCGWVMHR